MENKLVLLLVGLAATQPTNADESSLIPELKPLEFLVGYCWSGQFPESNQTDTHCYEPVFSGKHLRDRHVVANGSASMKARHFIRGMRMERRSSSRTGIHLAA